ncbi:MAG: NADH:flavin oxidoreductase/NADH oxidase family protein [Rhodoferax sp.]|nr:NADH:flavin oxidoreductase/NADH oxidase family protein [Rhodoferax sp.]MCF8210700.1 NADH:flavin oxidoreductase/NADH oxidase family protein [Rhodoferax sp.]
MNLFEPLTLPNGTILSNRVAKAAMEENMCDADHAPSDDLLELYKAWAGGGAGMLLTGNVMVDRRGMTGPGGVVLEDEKHLDRFKQWAQIAKAGGAQVWMQISHPGRQMMAALGQQTWSASAVALEMGNLSSKFSVPKEMTAADIDELKSRFVRTAKLAQEAGFDGVQIHAAHGYLLSQFLSPITNKRNDQWGGSVENRARLLIEIVKAVRATVAPEFVVAVKLNSADFQRGGFSSDDAKLVVEMLNGLKVDLVELSGGSYEAPAMQGQARDGRTLAREAYFLEFAKDILAVARMPLMVTGGIRRKEVAEQVVQSGVALAGIATALAIAPNLPNEWRAGKDTTAALPPITWSNKTLASLAYMACVKYQLRRLSHGSETRPKVSPLWALIVQQIKTAKQTKQYRRWMENLAPG